MLYFIFKERFIYISKKTCLFMLFYTYQPFQQLILPNTLFLNKRAFQL